MTPKIKYCTRPVFSITHTVSTIAGSATSIEHRTMLLYDRTCTKISVDSARKHIFSTKARSMDAIPPTAAALVQHTKRLYTKVGMCGDRRMSVIQNYLLQRPVDGIMHWHKSATKGWEPLWTLLPEAAASCSELLRCGCQKWCRGLCKCVRAALKFTSLCRCSGNCEHNDSN